MYELSEKTLKDAYKLYNVTTPEEFVIQCKKRGYVKKLSNQLKLDL